MDGEDPKIQNPDSPSLQWKKKQSHFPMPSRGRTSRAEGSETTVPAKEGFHGLWLGLELSLANDNHRF